MGGFAEPPAAGQLMTPGSHSLRVGMRVLRWLVWEDPHLLALPAP